MIEVQLYTHTHTHTHTYCFLLTFPVECGWTGVSRPFKSPLTPAVFEQFFCSFSANFVALKLQFVCWRNKLEICYHLFFNVARDNDNFLS